MSAAEALAESVTLHRQEKNKFGAADALIQLGRALCHLGRLGEASARLAEGLGLRIDIGDQWGLADTLDAMAGLALVQGDAEHAACLFGAAAGRWQAIGYPARPAGTLALVARDQAAARAALGDAAFGAAYAAGQSMAPEAAFASALAGIDRNLPEPVPALPARPEKPPTARLGGLTAREVEIVRLVAEGLTDRAVAERLFISPRTVDTHLRNIFAKVRVTSRAGLASWATRKLAGIGPD